MASGVEGAGDPVIVRNEAHRVPVAEAIRTCRWRGRHPPRAGRPQHGTRGGPCRTAGPEGLPMRAADRSRRPRGARRTDFQHAATVAAELALKGKLVTFGIVAHAPETGYGYIRRGDGPARPTGWPSPSRSRVQPRASVRCLRRLLLEFWHVRVQGEPVLAELGAFASTSRGEQGGVRGGHHGPRLRAHRQGGVREVPQPSIDYAVMEKTRDAIVLPLDAGWSDVGSWASLFDALPAARTATCCAATCWCTIRTIATCIDQPFGDRGGNG